MGCEETDIGTATQAGDIARSVVGALAENLVNAQFSRQEERRADDFGVMFLQRKGLGRDPAILALMKLASLGNEHSIMASHPSPEARAQRQRAIALSPPPAEPPSLWQRIFTWPQDLLPTEDDHQARGYRGGLYG